MRAHQQAVFRLAYLLLGDPQEAEDMAQETFVRVYRSLERFDASRPLRPWLMRIALNLARNRRRSLTRYRAALERAFRNDPASDQNPPSAGIEADHSQEAELLWQAVGRLRQTDREIVYMRYFLELSEVEMAGALAVARGTVKSRLHRALARLRRIAEEEFSDLERIEQ